MCHIFCSYKYWLHGASYMKAILTINVSTNIHVPKINLFLDHNVSRGVCFMFSEDD